MSRPTTLIIDSKALLHNLKQIKNYAPGKKIIAMLKANAYGCGVRQIAPVLDGKVDAFGVACLEEALAIHNLGVKTQCILFQGVFSPDEYKVVSQHQFACIIHQPHQLEWLLNTPLPNPIKIWVKVNTGMHRLGFKSHEVDAILNALHACSWVDKNIGLMTHLASADEPQNAENIKQINLFATLDSKGISQRSIANSAAIIAFPQAHADIVRPGIMLYGVSPFNDKTAPEIGLIPVMRFISAVTALYTNPPMAPVGYGGTWHSKKSSVIGVVPVGYGDGYPRHISSKTPVWIRGREVLIVGRVSMDMLTIDLTEHPDIQIGDSVELWGTNILVERIAKSAGTIPYELLCQTSERVRLY